MGCVQNPFGKETDAFILQGGWIKCILGCGVDVSCTVVSVERVGVGSDHRAGVH